jgi:hypothetical protein
MASIATTRNFAALVFKQPVFAEVGDRLRAAGIPPAFDKCPAHVTLLPPWVGDPEEFREKVAAIPRFRATVVETGGQPRQRWTSSQVVVQRVKILRSDAIGDWRADAEVAFGLSSPRLALAHHITLVKGDFGLAQVNPIIGSALTDLRLAVASITILSKEKSGEPWQTVEELALA